MLRDLWRAPWSRKRGVLAEQGDELRLLLAVAGVVLTVMLETVVASTLCDIVCGGGSWQLAMFGASVLAMGVVTAWVWMSAAVRYAGIIRRRRG